MTEDAAGFSQFRAAACREYTLPRDKEASQPKGWIQGNTKIGRVLEVATSCLQGATWSGNQKRVYEQGPFSRLGHNFSWLGSVGHKLEQQRAGLQRAGNLR